jgi:hypothetical protein
VYDRGHRAVTGTTGLTGTTGTTGTLKTSDPGKPLILQVLGSRRRSLPRHCCSRGAARDGFAAGTADAAADLGPAAVAGASVDGWHQLSCRPQGAVVSSCPWCVFVEILRPRFARPFMGHVLTRCAHQNIDSAMFRHAALALPWFTGTREHHSLSSKAHGWVPKKYPLVLGHTRLTAPLVQRQYWSSKDQCLFARPSFLLFRFTFGIPR